MDVQKNFLYSIKTYNSSHKEDYTMKEVEMNKTDAPTKCVGAGFICGG